MENSCKNDIVTVYDVYGYIDSFAPFGTQDGFDNSGLLVDNGGEVTKIAVCLDITNEIVDECAKKGAELIVSHHPVIFKGIKRLDKSSPVYRLVKNDISAICAHTPLDMAEDGVSDLMYRMMGFPEPEKAEVLDVVHPGKGIGYGKIARFSAPLDPEELVMKVHDVFNCDVTRYTAGRPVYSCAVCSGAGNDEIYACIEKGIDALITGDVKHHGFVDAANAGMTVIDAGHYKTEVIICDVLKRKLAEKFPGTKVFIPDSEHESCGYVATTHRTEES